MALLARVCIGQQIPNCIRLGAGGVDENAVPVLALLGLYRPLTTRSPKSHKDSSDKVMSWEFM